MYYLAGRTALALQINHRKSYDLDFFRIGVHERINFNAIAGELKKLEEHVTDQRGIER